MLSGLGQTAIDQAAAEVADELIELRRDIHRHPELAGQERRTAALVAERLRAAGLEVTTGVGGHGVVAIVDGAVSGAVGDVAGGPVVAYRADLDAVDDDELFTCDFASQVPGAAHLCGHDLHTAIGVGIALVLARLREHLAGRVVLLFQPAEETLEGARAMIDDGVLERTAPREIYALHCAPIAVGSFAFGPGQPGQDYFRIELTGPDSLAEARRLVTMIDALSTIDQPQTPEQLRQLLADLQVPHGPLARFVFARAQARPVDGGAQVDASVRAWPDSAYAEIRADVRRRLDKLPHARLALPGQPFPAMRCTPEMNAAAATHLRTAHAPAALFELRAAYPFNGDDFALFLRQVPGAMFYLGVANPQAGMNGIPHSPDFAADERAIGIGVRAMAGLLAARLVALA